MTEPVSLSPLLSALLDLVRWLDATGRRAAVIGGVAVSLRSRPRTTLDIDALVLRHRSEWGRFLEGGAPFGFVPRVADPLEFADRTRVLLVRHKPSGIPVDISLGALPFEEEVVARADSIPLAQTNVPVASTEDLIIMKAVAHRSQDLVDIETLLDTAEELDLSRIRRWVREFSSVLESPEIFEDLEKLLPKRRV